MKWTLGLGLVISLAGCGSGSRCAGVTCSSHGVCVVNDEQPRCACDSGFTATGLNCVPVAPTGTSTCAGVGATCSSNGNCCNFQQGDGFCVSGRCADSCTSNGQCNSGCCAVLVSGNRACSSPTNCSPSCRAVNSSCSVNGDCCNFLAGDGFCVDGFCADSCVRNSECTSNCCALLVGGGSVCSSRSFCP